MFFLFDVFDLTAKFHNHVFYTNFVDNKKDRTRMFESNAHSLYCTEYFLIIIQNRVFIFYFPIYYGSSMLAVLKHPWTWTEMAFLV